MTDREYDELTPKQKDQIWHGNACGHPSGIPQDENAARTYKWMVDDKGKVVGRKTSAALSRFF